ncbi:hypothetical protein D3C87_83400 [compost metagenome]
MDTQMKVTPESKQVLSTTVQDELCLELSPVDQSTADEEIQECNAHLFIKGSPIKHVIAEIPHDEVTKLKEAALLLKTIELNYVLGLKMHFIIDNDDVNLLYQPLYMSRPPSIIGEPVYTVKEGDYYRFDPVQRKFSKMTSSKQVNTLKTAYTTHIRIKHRLDVTPTGYIPGLDSDAVIFPFQTIDDLIRENEGNGFFIHNSIRKEAVGGAYSIQHCLLLSSAILTGNSFKGKFANRSHLCPPSCNSIQYALAKV